VVDKLRKKGVGEQRCVTAETLLAERASGLAPSALGKLGKEVCDRFTVDDVPVDDVPENPHVDGLHGGGRVRAAAV